MLRDLGADAVMAKIADQDFRAATSNRFPSDQNSAPAHSGGVCCLWLHWQHMHYRQGGRDESNAYRAAFGLNAVFADLRRSFLVRRSPPAEEGGWLAIWANGWRRSSSLRSS